MPTITKTVEYAINIDSDKEMLIDALNAHSKRIKDIRISLDFDVRDLPTSVKELIESRLITKDIVIDYEWDEEA